MRQRRSRSASTRARFSPKSSVPGSSRFHPANGLAIRRMIPAFTNRWIELFKLTALASAISYPDLMYTTKTIANAYYNPVEMYSLAGAIYLLLIYPMVRATYRLERSMRREGANG
jgi:ABC-type amino acid transport system permease subunit